MENLINYSLMPGPLDSFLGWYEDAKNTEQNAEAMTLSTIDSKLNRPDSRTVLYKGIKSGNFIFYTNYFSNKSKELESNNKSVILFYWHVSKRQVKVHGKVSKMSQEESKIYFRSRDRQSQLASYISEQSSPIKDKAALMKKLEDASKKYDGVEIPFPVNWGGYLFEPYEFEFFVYGDYRINDRFLFQKNEKSWNITRLQP